jgi:hypothetical protein
MICIDENNSSIVNARIKCSNVSTLLTHKSVKVRQKSRNKLTQDRGVE